MRYAFITLVLVAFAGCDPQGTCEQIDQKTCTDTLKSSCKAESGYFISNAHCSTLGYRCKDVRGVWSKRCD